MPKTLFLLIFTFISLSDFSYAQGGPITSGYVLTHEHPTYGMAFGGNYAFAGAKGNYINGIMEKGYTANCGGCKVLGRCDHGEVKGSLMGALGSLGRDMGDHRSYMGPLTNSNSHLRYSTEWVHEAFQPSEEEFQDTNMKIMVAFAVENEAMCEQLYYANKGNGGAGGNGYACSKGDSFKSLERQLNSIKAWVKRNRSWMQIAYSARQARQIVNSNKLAIILGIESEYSFGAEDRTFDPVSRLNRYYDQGVRTFYLAHKINSRLSGADIFLPKGNLGGRAIRATQAISGCFYYDDNVGQFPLQGTTNNRLCDNNCGDNAFKGGGPLGGVFNKCSFKISDISEVNMTGYVAQGGGSFNGFNIYPKPPGFTLPFSYYRDPNLPSSQWQGSRMAGNIERNNLGLSHDGERVVREAMTKGMIVNIDHVSSVARKYIRTLSREFKDYPLNAFHIKPNQRLTNKKGFKRHEYDFSNKELGYIRETGGFFGLRMGPTDSRKYKKSGIEVNCPKTSTETAKMLAWLLDQGMSVGYALDYGTITEAVHSRTKYSCLRGLGDDKIHMYEGHVAEGLSHVGMMKKWHQELQAIGLKKEYLEKLRNNGVEQFIQMWENSEARANAGRQIPRQIFASEVSDEKCREDSDCANSEFCAFTGADPRKNKCKAKKAKGKVCTSKRQCLSNRCPLGTCATADECQLKSDCNNNQYCGDPIAGKRTCKNLLAKGKACTKPDQCSTGRCFALRCAARDECQSKSDCNNNQFCGDPIAGKRTCKNLLAKGKACTKADQCSTGRCFALRCAARDECRSNSNCNNNQYCGDPIAGKRTCKNLLLKGKACTKRMQCASGKCKFLKCK